MPRQASRPRHRAVTDLGLVDWYQLPTWYDAIHRAGTAAEVTGLERVALTYTRSRGTMRWFEPACGTGRYLREAASRGVACAGLDLEPAMIDYARAAAARRGLTIELRVGDMTDFRARQPADLAFCLVNSLRHLPSDRALLDHLGCIERALKRGGVYIVGLNTTVFAGETESEDVWDATHGRTEYRQIATYLPSEGPGTRDRFETVINHLVRRTPTAEIHADNTYQLRCYSMPQWLDVLRRSPFDAVAATDEDGNEVATQRDIADVWGYAWFVLRRRNEA
ncbi:MAG: class I SAM-dependent methyltransferase [Planctomycetota bacterium]